MRPTENTNYPTYTVTASNGDAFRINIEIPCITKNLAKVIAQEACASFRDVRVCDDETGEVMFSQYVESDAWAPKKVCRPIWETIQIITELYNLGAC